jgi:zinc transport system substrate-binding protein
MPRLSVIKKLNLLFLLLSIALAISCVKEEPKGVTDKIEISVTILPIADIVKKIGGDKANVSVMIPAGASPTSFEPSIQQIKKLAESEVYVKVGGPFLFEKVWLEKIRSVNVKLIYIDCSQGIEIIDNNPHIWLGPKEIIKITENIYNGLSVYSPANKDYFENNKQHFLIKLDSINSRIKSDFEKIQYKKVMVYHPAWYYFTSQYNLEEIGIEVEGKEPKAGDLKQLISLAKKNNIKAVFVEPQFNSSSAEAIASEIGAKVITINPLPEDLLNNLIDVSEKIMKNVK